MGRTWRDWIAMATAGPDWRRGDDRTPVVLPTLAIRVLGAIFLAVSVGMLVPGGSSMAAGAVWNEVGASDRVWLADDNDSEETSPLSDGRTPPYAEEAQIAFFDANQGQETKCSGAFSGLALQEPTFMAVSNNSTGQDQEVGDIVFLCFGGFAPNQNVEVELKSSVGETLSNRLRTGEDGVAQWRWLSVPPTPIREYAVTADQGRRHVSDTFTLRSATSPRLLIAPPSDRAGAEFRVYLVGLDTIGLEDGAKVRLRLHRREGTDLQPVARYVTDLPTVTIDQRGNAMVTIQTSRDDRKGQYIMYAVDPKDHTKEHSSWVFEVR